MKKIERYKQILEELEYRKELAELPEKIELSKATIRKYLSELKNRGLVTRLRKGIYKRTAEGTVWLKNYKVLKSEHKPETEGSRVANTNNPNFPSSKAWEYYLHLRFKTLDKEIDKIKERIAQLENILGYSLDESSR